LPATTRGAGMRVVDSPRVFLIAEPAINTAGMLAYLREVGGEAWLRRVFGKPGLNTPDVEGLVEFCGRLCYRSWEPGLNKNVTRVREDRGDYLLNVLRSGHGSVLEHACFTFAIHDLSRVCTAELNRHRAGVAISEQSLRYVRLDEVPLWEPGGLHPETYVEGRDLIEQFERFYGRAVAREGLDEGDFARKKLLTSKLRRWAPLGIATEEAWTGNVRSIRHVIEMRTAEHAEEEIRIVADQIATIVSERCPLLFGDYELQQHDSGVPEWTTEHGKV
jgi:thymidylate synthase (FAD)